jgi:hypothetical protein
MRELVNKVHGVGPGLYVREIALCEAANLVAVAWVQSAASGPERGCSYSGEAPVAGSMTEFAGEEKVRVAWRNLRCGAWQ